MEEAQERMREKYQELVEDCRRNGWRTRFWPVEVGSRGFASHSLSRMPLGSRLGSDQPRSSRQDEDVCCKTQNTQ